MQFFTVSVYGSTGPRAVGPGLKIFFNISYLVITQSWTRNEPWLAYFFQWLMNTENGHLVTRGKILSTDLFNWSQILSTDSLMECMEVTQKNLLVDIGAKGVRVKWYTSGRSRGSLRSKRFQSSYCAKVRAEAKKRLKGEGRRVPSFPSPSPVIHFFFLVPAF